MELDNFDSAAVRHLSPVFLQNFCLSIINPHLVGLNRLKHTIEYLCEISTFMFPVVDTNLWLFVDNTYFHIERLGLKENQLGRKPNFRTKCSSRIKITRSK